MEVNVKGVYYSTEEEVEQLSISDDGDFSVFVIIKEVINDRGVKMPVVLLDGSDEVLEFSDLDNATATAKLFELNSECGWKYIVKKI